MEGHGKKKQGQIKSMKPMQRGPGISSKEQTKKPSNADTMLNQNAAPFVPSRAVQSEVQRKMKPQTEKQNYNEYQSDENAHKPRVGDSRLEAAVNAQPFIPQNTTYSSRTHQQSPSTRRMQPTAPPFVPRQIDNLKNVESSPESQPTHFEIGHPGLSPSTDVSEHSIIPSTSSSHHNRTHSYKHSRPKGHGPQFKGNPYISSPAPYSQYDVDLQSNHANSMASGLPGGSYREMDAVHQPVPPPYDPTLKHGHMGHGKGQATRGGGGAGGGGGGMPGRGLAGSGAHETDYLSEYYSSIKDKIPGQIPLDALLDGSKTRGGSKSEGLLLEMQLRRYLELAQACSQMPGTSTSQIPQAPTPPPSIPAKISHYDCIVPLEVVHAPGDAQTRQSVLKCASTCYKGIDTRDNQTYVLRQIHSGLTVSMQEVNRQANEVLRRWQRLSWNSCLSRFKAVFTGRGQQGKSIFFVHDYHPHSVPLSVAHLEPITSEHGLRPPDMVPERLIWSYMLQLLACIRSAHHAGLALREQALHSSKILVQSPNRIRIGSIGVYESLHGYRKRGDDMQALMSEDIKCVGRLMMQVACNVAPGRGGRDHLYKCYSQQLSGVIEQLQQNADYAVTWSVIGSAITDYCMSELLRLHSFNDMLCNELCVALENGRLLSLLTKLGFINERPDRNGDTSWADTGDRYVLQLFRNYVFHSHTTNGEPITQWGHVLEALQKLDAGVKERIMLMSRDQSSILVVSYESLKKQVEQAYSELIESNTKRTQQNNVYTSP